MKDLTITVLDGGEPVSGASVTVGEVLQKSLTADENGQVSKSVDDDFQVFSSIAVELDGELILSAGPMRFAAGNSYTFSVPAIEA